MCLRSVGGVGRYGEVYWNANLSCYLPLRRSCQDPLYTPLFSSVAQVSAPIVHRKLMWDHSSHTRASVGFSGGSVGALTLLIFFLNLQPHAQARHAWKNVLGNSAADFESDSVAEGVITGNSKQLIVSYQHLLFSAPTSFLFHSIGNHYK